MKLPRTEEDYGGGGGSQIFENRFFRVVLWSHGRGDRKRTALEIKLGDSFNSIHIYFDGIHKLKSNKKCFEQLTCSEIIKMIEGQKDHAFKMGQADRSSEIGRLIRGY